MRNLTLFLLCLAVTLPGAAPAFAQAGRFQNRNPLQRGEQPLQTLPATPQLGRAEPWPRLDRGAVLCRTAADLDRRISDIRAQNSGGTTLVLPGHCVLIAARTPIEIVERAGLGRTQVRITAGGQLGWTDAWLPDRVR